MPALFRLAPIAVLTVVGALLTAPTPATAAPPTITVGDNPGSIAITPDGSKAYVTNFSSDTVSVISIASSTVIATIPVGNEPSGVAVSPDGSKAYVANRNTGGGNSSVSVISVASNTVTRTISLNVGTASAVAFLPNGQKAYVANTDSWVVSVIDSTTNSFERYIDVQQPMSFAVAPDGTAVFVATRSGFSPGTLYRFDPATDSLNGSSFPGSDGQISLSPDGSFVMLPEDSSGELGIVSSTLDVPLEIVPGGSNSRAVAVTPVGSLAYIANGSTPTVSVVDVGARAIVETIGVGSNPSAIAITPNGAKVLVVNSGDDTVSIISRSETTTSVPTERLFGATRYETAVAISQKFAPGVPVVYVATGRDFPDALSAAAAAAAQHGPLLLTEPTSLPAAARTEIQRLAPTTIVVVGGDSAVSQGVRAELLPLAGPGGLIELRGTDRYDTSRKIVSYAFDVAPRLFLATGANFPDALSAGAAAGAQGQPVLLVPGTSSAPDQATLDLLDDLGTTDIVMVGGTRAITYGYVYDFYAHLSTAFSREWGGNRYATSQDVSEREFDTASDVYLATGSSFPDALAGAALAGRRASPLFVIPQNCVPQRVINDIVRLGATRVYILGGTSALAGTVDNLTRCG